MSASTLRARGRRSARAGLVTAVLLVVGLVPAGAARAGAAAVDPGAGDSAPPGRVVTAWGSNQFAQSRVPAGLRGATAVAAGSSHSLARRSDGTVVAWATTT